MSLQIKSKINNYLIFIVIGLNMFVSHMVTALIFNEIIIIPNFKSIDAGLIFWIWGVGISVLIVFIYYRLKGQQSFTNVGVEK